MPGVSYAGMSESRGGFRTEYSYIKVDNNSSGLKFRRVLNQNIR